MSLCCHYFLLVIVFMRFSAAVVIPRVESDSIRVRYFYGVNDEITVEAADSIDLLIICSPGEERNLISIWKTYCVIIISLQGYLAKVRILSPSKDYSVYNGQNETAVVDLYKASQSILYFMPTWQITSRVDLLVFNKSCVGVHSLQRYKVLLEVYRIDFWKVLKLLTGLFLFFGAPYLSGNVLFYYTSGVTLGICASLLIIVFVISRFIPKKIGAVSFVLGGWALVVYLLQMLVSNLRTIMLRHQGLVFTYLGVVGFISFAICYKRGHVTDVKTRNLIKWCLQGVAFVLIFLSTEWSEVAVSIGLIVLAIHAFPDVWVAKIRTYWRRRFPPKVKKLTEEEYYHQAAVQTRHALEELRRYCSSPQCNSWRTMRRLKSPIRFAEFIEGDSHLTDEEMLNYEVEVSQISQGDDSSSDDETFGANGYATVVH